MRRPVEDEPRLQFGFSGKLPADDANGWDDAVATRLAAAAECKHIEKVLPAVAAQFAMKEGAVSAADLPQHRRPAVRADAERKLRRIDCGAIAVADLEKPDFTPEEKRIDSTDIVSESGQDVGAQAIRCAVSDGADESAQDDEQMMG